MSDGRKYYCICDSNCKFETMTKEQILAAIAQAVETGSVGDCDTGFVTTIKEKNGGRGVTFWVGTQAQYNAIASKEENCMYIITDDTSGADLLQTVARMAQECEASAQSAAAAAKSAAQLLSVDVSDKVSLEVHSSAENNTVTLISHKYEYNRALGIVFYQIIFKLSGTVQNNYNDDSVNFVNSGGYKASEKGGKYYGAAGNDRAGETICGAGFTHGTTDSVAVFFKENLNNQNMTMGVSGWYFCDGE